MPPSVYWVLCLGAGLGGVVKGLSGFGNAIINLLVWVFFTALGVNAGTLLQAVICDCAACLASSIPLWFMTRAHKTADWRLVVTILAFTAAGSPVGAALLTRLNARWVELAMACVLLLVIVVHVRAPQRVFVRMRTWSRRRSGRYAGLEDDSTAAAAAAPTADPEVGPLAPADGDPGVEEREALVPVGVDPAEPLPLDPDASLHRIAVDVLPSPMPSRRPSLNLTQLLPGVRWSSSGASIARLSSSGAGCVGGAAAGPPADPGAADAAAAAARQRPRMSTGGGGSGGGGAGGGGGSSAAAVLGLPPPPLPRANAGAETLDSGTGSANLSGGDAAEPAAPRMPVSRCLFPNQCACHGQGGAVEGARAEGAQEEQQCLLAGAGAVSSGQPWKEGSSSGRAAHGCKGSEGAAAQRAAAVVLVADAGGGGAGASGGSTAACSGAAEPPACISLAAGALQDGRQSSLQKRPPATTGTSPFQKLSRAASSGPDAAGGSDKEPLLDAAGASSSTVGSGAGLGDAAPGDAAEAGAKAGGRGCVAGVRRWAAQVDWKEMRRILAYGSVASFAGGVMSGMTGIGGPPIMYMYALLNTDKDVVRGTNAVTNALQVRLVTYLVMGIFVRADLPLYIATAAVSLVGLAAGNALAGKLDQRGFSRVLLALMIICCGLLFAASAGLTGR